MRLVVLFLMSIAAIQLFGQQEAISFSLDAPEDVVAGNEFEVILTFKKGDLKDYSRFSQDLPSGFTASNVVSPNADFTFFDQRIRIIWLKLPAEQEVEVKYVIDVHERLSGKLELTGTFAYVDMGEREYLNLPEPEVVNILPNPDIDQSLVIDISEFGTIKTPESVVDPDIENVAEDFAEIVKQEPADRFGKTEVQADKSTAVTAGDAAKKAGTSVIDIPTLEKISGVTFRVQVAAVRYPIFGKVIFADYELLKNVKVEKDNGWNKYTVGPLASYEDAVRLKNQVMSETPVDAAFVIAYRDGRRVPVDTVR